MSIIQICAAAVAGMLLAVQFKAQKPEYGIYISIALSLLIFFSVLEKIETIAEVIRKIGIYRLMICIWEHCSKCLELLMWQNLHRTFAKMRDIRRLQDRLRFSGNLQSWYLVFRCFLRFWTRSGRCCHEKKG